MAKDQAINERLRRIEEIIEQLEVEECSPDEGEEVYQEGQRLLAEVRDVLSGERGEITEIE